MTLALAVGAGWLVAELGRRRRQIPGLAPVGLVLILWQPWLLGLAPLGLAWWGIRGWTRNRRSEDRLDEDLTLLAELVALGLSAGLSTAGALRSAGRHVGPGLRAEVVTLLRRAHRHGLAAALSEAPGKSRRLWLQLARAHHSGTPVGAAVAAFLDQRRDEERVRRLESARRLPVRLLFPLTLLVLPGLLLVIVAPGIQAALERLT